MELFIESKGTKWEKLSAWERNKWRYIAKYKEIEPSVEPILHSALGTYRYDGVELLDRKRKEGDVNPTFVAENTDRTSFVAVHFLAKKYKGAFISGDSSEVRFHFPFPGEHPSKEELSNLLNKIEGVQHPMRETIGETVAPWDKEKDEKKEKQMKNLADTLEAQAIFERLCQTNLSILLENMRALEASMKSK